jgi:hypothetical protein
LAAFDDPQFYLSETLATEFVAWRLTIVRRIPALVIGTEEVDGRSKVVRETDAEGGLCPMWRWIS